MISLPQLLKTQHGHLNYDGFFLGVLTRVGHAFHCMAIRTRTCVTGYEQIGWPQPLRSTKRGPFFVPLASCGIYRRQERGSERATTVSYVRTIPCQLSCGLTAVPAVRKVIFPADETQRVSFLAVCMFDYVCAASRFCGNVHFFATIPQRTC